MTNLSGRALLESQADIEAIFKALDESILLLSADGTILDLNDMAARRLGGVRGDFIGGRLGQFLEASAGERYRQYFKQTLNGDKVDFEEEDHGIWRSVRLQPVLDDHGKMVRLVVVSRDVTTGKQTDIELGNSEAKYRRIFENVQDTYYEASLDGRLLEVSPSVENLSKGQYSCYDLIGKSMEDFYTVQVEREAFFAAIRKNGFVTDFELTVQNRDGSCIPCAVSSKIVFDAQGQPVKICGNIRDIKDRKQAEDAVARERMLLRTLIDNLPDTIYVKDLEGRKLLANPADWKLLGFSSENDVIGKTDLEVFDPQIGERGYKDDMEILMKGEPIINREENFIDPAGNECWLHTTKIPLVDEAGKVTGLMGIGRNITDRRKSEQLLARQAAEMKELIATKDRFFSIVAHDLRGPLGSFLNLTRIMVEELHDLSLARIQQMLTNMSRSALTVYEMLENLLEWSRMQRGLTNFEPAAIILNSKIDQFLQVLIDSALDKQIFMQYEIPEDLKVFADERMLESTLRNMVSNAIKFTSHGGQVALFACKREDGAIIISVKDTGIGMSREILDNLFRIDVNVSRPGTSGESSSGLGLLLCKEFVEKHGGRIRAESQEDLGSTFYVEFPGNKPDIG